MFANSIPDKTCNVDFIDVNQFAQNVVVALYEYSKSSQDQVRVINVANTTTNSSRWDKLLNDANV